ncbi:MAG: metallophosphoesterase [Ruminococcus sp.]|jgi:predicted MPP superfamily phosphohydrolase
MKRYVIKHYIIRSEKLNGSANSIRIVFISDFHNTSFGENLKKLKEDLEKLQADLILIGGDIVVGKPGEDMEQTKKLLSVLPAGVPVFAANGNHEYRLKIYPEVYGSMYQEYRKMLDRYHVTLLENESALTQIGGVSMAITGYELPREYYDRFYRGELPAERMSDALPMQDDTVYQILLAHYPKYFTTYVKWRPDLILSGHYHGGIIRLGEKYPVVGNDFTLFPRYGYGYFEKGRSSMIVSAGMGEHTIPLRLWNPRELVVADVEGKR